MKSVIPSDVKIYYQGNYWNDIEEVRDYMNKGFCPEDPKYWVQDFQDRYAKKQFKKALFICCGNGWLDREFIDRKIAAHVDAFDYSTDLLNEAEQLKGNRSIKYFQADANTLVLKENYYDLIVNHAGLHHVQYINKFLKTIAISMKPEAVFVNLDYIGPRRNQYGRQQWQHAEEVNALLPNSIRMDPLSYPDLPTMLVSDPTEAIHSDIIIPTLERYFFLKERHDINGGLAYLLLTHNEKIKTITPTRRKKLVAAILKKDLELTNQHKIPPLFSYFIAQPNKSALKNKALCNDFQKQENLREMFAQSHLGCYNWNEYFQVLSRRVTSQIKIMIRKFRYSLKTTIEEIHG